jgi:hypothetical protein
VRPGPIPLQDRGNPWPCPPSPGASKPIRAAGPQRLARDLRRCRSSCLQPTAADPHRMKRAIRPSIAGAMNVRTRKPVAALMRMVGLHRILARPTSRRELWRARSSSSCSRGSARRLLDAGSPRFPAAAVTARLQGEALRWDACGQRPRHPAGFSPSRHASRQTRRLSFAKTSAGGPAAKSFSRDPETVSFQRCCPSHMIPLGLPSPNLDTYTR